MVGSTNHDPRATDNTNGQQFEDTRTQDEQRLDKRRRKAAKVHKKNHELNKHAQETQHEPAQRHKGDHH